MRKEIEDLLRLARIREIIRSAQKKQSVVVHWIRELDARLHTNREQPMDDAVKVFFLHRLVNLQSVTNCAAEYGV